MTLIKIFMAAAVLLASQALAQDPEPASQTETKAQQCEMYGSYEASEGIWEVCEGVDSVTTDDEGGDAEQE
jgi:hypothetical protein